MTEVKKPTEFITEARELIARDLLAKANIELLSGLGQAHASATAIGWYLDEEHERRQAWERGVEERLGKLERKTSSTEYVMVEEDLGPMDAVNAAGNDWETIRHLRAMRVRWCDPDGEKPGPIVYAFTEEEQLRIKAGETPVMGLHGVKGWAKP